MMGLGHSDWSFEANIHGIGVGGVDGEEWDKMEWDIMEWNEMET